MDSVVIWLKRTHLVTIHKPRGRFQLVPGCSLHSGRGDSRVFDEVDLAGLRDTTPAHRPATILYRSNWTWSIIKIKSHDSYNSPLPLPIKQAHLSGDAALMMQHRIRSVRSARLYGPDGLFFSLSWSDGASETLLYCSKTLRPAVLVDPSIRRANHESSKKLCLVCLSSWRVSELSQPFAPRVMIVHVNLFFSLSMGK
ncbi:hypothetical protein LZ31DRAFT_380890 [Colletotrichum somersetense]|nr:hypothetical protein LZ31DRAFT_380890 [Colletotrichum somersetense]